MTKLAKLFSNVHFIAIASLAITYGCADAPLAPADDPVALIEGGWGGPAELANCAHAEICELDRWANESDFRVMVRNKDAEVSSSDSSVLEILSVEPNTRVVASAFGCIFDCGSSKIDYLSVMVRTKSPGDAEFVIDGPAGDQRRLAVHVEDVDTVQVVDVISGDTVESVGQALVFLRLEAFDDAGERLGLQGSWSVDVPDRFLLHVGIFEDGAATLDYAASALVESIDTGPVSTVLRVAAGEMSLAIPVEL